MKPENKDIDKETEEIQEIEKELNKEDVSQEYQLIVLFKRNMVEDIEAYGTSDHELMVGLAEELQAAYDECAISGHFQVQCVVKEI